MRRSDRVGRLTAAVLLLFATWAAQADDVQWSPVGEAKEILQALEINDCWSDAPTDARVFCVAARPEHAGMYRLPVNLINNSATTTDIVIGFRSMDLTATGDVDYAVVDRTLTLTWDAPTAETDVTFLDDTVEEGHEAFVLEVTASAGVDVSWSHFHFTILDEESIRLTVNDYSASESNGEVKVDIDLSAGVTWPFEFDIATEDGTAVSPDDYPDVDESVRIVPDVNQGALISVSRFYPIVNDNIHEPDETFKFVVTGVSYIGLGTAEGVMTILDDEDLPGLSIGDSRALEHAGNMAFAVTLDRASAQQVTVAYRTMDGSYEAQAPADYHETTGTLTFAPGQLNATIEVPIVDDDFFESWEAHRSADETFSVHLDDPENARLVDDIAIGTILDDDPSFEVTAGSAPNEDVEYVELEVALLHLRHPDETVLIPYSTGPNPLNPGDLPHRVEDTTAGEDYLPTSGTLTFAYTEEGANSRRLQSFRVGLVDDNVSEHDLRPAGPLGALGMNDWCRHEESNPGPSHYK